MCWVSISKPEFKVAEDNISVTKIVRIRKNILRAYFMGIKYSIGEIYYSKIRLELSLLSGGYYKITEGLHSYKSSCPIILSKAINCTILSVNSSNNGFRLLSRYDTMGGANLGIMSCIIPKGSTYYENENGEIVSDTIKPIYCYKII